MFPYVSTISLGQSDNRDTGLAKKVARHCQFNCLKLVHVCMIFQISRLIYTNSGNAILALASNAIHLLWKWQRNERNSSGKVYLIYTALPNAYIKSLLVASEVLEFCEPCLYICRQQLPFRLSSGSLTVAL